MRAQTAVSNYWNESLEARAPLPALAGAASADVAVIGAGYTGLATAYHLKRTDPSLEVAVLEAETAGFGASGRNAGFVMTLFGASSAMMAGLHGRARVREAYRYAAFAIDGLEALIAEHGIDCDFARTGFLKVATSPRYARRIEKEIAFFHALGIADMAWLGPAELKERVASPTFLGGMLESHCGLLNPVKLADALRRLALAHGARLYEKTHAVAIAREGAKFRVATPRGTLKAEKLVFATNAYSHLVPGMQSRQLPAFAYVIATEPLSEDKRTALGWAGREGIEDARNFMHFYRLTPDNRVIAGGGPGFLPYGARMDYDASPEVWAHLERFIATTFPALSGVRVTHRWGGAFSVTFNSTPQIGTLYGGAAAYAVGCTGHGVAMAHANAAILADLALERRTAQTEMWFVNRRSLPLPPEPFRSIGARAVASWLALEDWWCDRG